MKLSNRVIFDDNFKGSFNNILKLELPASTALKLIKASKKINEHTLDVFKVRDTLLERCCEKNENGQISNGEQGPIFKSTEDRDMFIEQINSLLEETFEIDLVEKIKMPDDLIVIAEDLINLQSIIDID
jgi:hypothetical protein